jgi:hypothetical protein
VAALAVTLILGCADTNPSSPQYGSDAFPSSQNVYTFHPPQGMSGSSRLSRIMVDGMMYIQTGRQMSVSISEDEILGEITSVIPSWQEPTENGQMSTDIRSIFGRSTPIVGTSYVKRDNGLL